MRIMKTILGLMILLSKPFRPFGLSTVRMMNEGSKVTVAVIGGGAAGLSCAQRLGSSDKFLPTVFDTGRLRPGGRCASRLPNDIAKDKNEKYSYLSKTTIDHAAQILTVPKGDGFLEFEKQVQEWEKRGVIKRYPKGKVCDIVNPYDRDTKKYDKTRIQIRSIKGDMYYGFNGMQSIPQAIKKEGNFELQQDVWISPSNGAKLVNSEGKKRWELKAKGQVLGQFDKLIIAHNGKCADRLMSSSPAKDLHRLLRVNFAPNVAKSGGKRMTLNSIYSLTFAVSASDSSLSTALPSDKVTCGFIKNHRNLTFLSCNTRKYGNSDNGDYEVWTVLSSAQFGKAHKGPQENLPEDLKETVKSILYESIEEALVLPRGSLRGSAEDPAGSGCILESRVQLWGAAVPLNTWIPSEDIAQGFLYDGDYGVGTCGDWLLDSSLAGAWESGRRLAQFLIDTQDPKTVGLEGSFQAAQAVEKAGIGAL
eukprot:CAMPEP_0194257526 /NCGR_PEP_ID=MMETSP0158-20130606/39248_1 /TAXON_ID=33649 /ORGANISM="Thalassionema nitzschioides, Strain L26-B" /LENGTH=476 /DNA_ID=CAMNT_0038996597 /DNA_START=10 /DNA_END=1440 /DNA_ORIENTATION=-